MSATIPTTDCAECISSKGEEPESYKCKECSLLTANIVSRHFMGQHGRALLVNQATNVVKGHEEATEFRTGQHIVSDVFCAECNSKLGWYYVRAEEEAQKYKEGKYLLEKSALK